MSSSGISIGSVFASQNQLQQFQNEFQQLGKDLQSGNISAAQADFVTLQQYTPQPNATSSSSQSSNPIVQAFNHLSKDLQSGNLAAAQQDFSTILQDFQNQAPQAPHHHHHQSGGTQEGPIAQLLTQLGQALQSGNLSAAQQAYGTLQQDLQSSSLTTTESTSSESSSGSVSVRA